MSCRRQRIAFNGFAVLTCTNCHLVRKGVTIRIVGSRIMNKDVSQCGLIVWRVQKNRSAVVTHGGIYNKYCRYGEHYVNRIWNIFYIKVPVGVLYNNFIYAGARVCMPYSIYIPLIVIWKVKYAFSICGRD